MFTARIFMDYSRHSDATLATLAGKTLTDLTGNANFPDPTPTMDDYATYVNDYRTKHEAAAETGGRFATTAKDIARLALLQQMKRLASYVNFTADGDSNKLVSSGFILVPPPKNHTVPGVPLWVRVRRGAQQGQLMMDVAKSRYAWQYEYQVSNRRNEQGEVDWGDEVYATTKSRGNVVAGLERVVTYWMRVRAINGYGKGDWSEIASGSTE